MELVACTSSKSFDATIWKYNIRNNFCW
jgi:hypothetical protein